MPFITDNFYQFRKEISFVQMLLCHLQYGKAKQKNSSVAHLNLLCYSLDLKGSQKLHIHQLAL